MQLLRLYVPDQDMLRQPALFLDLRDYGMLSAKDQFTIDSMHSLPCWHEAPQNPLSKEGFLNLLHNTKENHLAWLSLLKAQVAWKIQEW